MSSAEYRRGVVYGLLLAANVIENVDMSALEKASDGGDSDDCAAVAEFVACLSDLYAIAITEMADQVAGIRERRG